MAGRLVGIRSTRSARRFASRRAKAYLCTTVALTALSLSGPLTAGATAWSTKLMLALAHILAAVIVIPMVTRRLSQVTPCR